MLDRLPEKSIKDLWVASNSTYYNILIVDLNRATCTFSPYELVLSDHEQVFPASQILQKVIVRPFNEVGAEQPVINVGEWWYRCVTWHTSPLPADY